MVATVLLETDHDALRDKWERARLAWTKPWVPKDGVAGETITRFVAVPLDGVNIVRARETKNGIARDYCYVDRTDKARGVDETLALADTVAGIFVWKTAVTDAQAQLFGQSAQALIALARQHCKAA